MTYVTEDISAYRNTGKKFPNYGHTVIPFITAQGIPEYRQLLVYRHTGINPRGITGIIGISTFLFFTGTNGIEIVDRLFATRIRMKQIRKKYK